MGIRLIGHLQDYASAVAIGVRRLAYIACTGYLDGDPVGGSTLWSASLRIVY
jgi:hypothetical protein